MNVESNDTPVCPPATAGRDWLGGSFGRFGDRCGLPWPTEGGHGLSKGLWQGIWMLIQALSSALVGSKLSTPLAN